MALIKRTTISAIMQRVFFSPEKTVFIYTEDKPSDKLFYNLLLGRLASDEFKIIKIEPIGSRSDVIEASLLDKTPQAPSLYIIDGDIKLMLGVAMESQNLIALDRYCIENFLCCEEGLIDYLEIKLGRPKEEIRKSLSYEKFLLKNGKYLLELYYRYAVSFQIGAGHSFKCLDNLINQRTKEVDKNLIKLEIESVEAAIKAKLKSDGFKAYTRESKRLIDAVKYDNPFSLSTIVRVISGKDQLLPLLMYKLKKIDISSKSYSRDTYKRLLAERVHLASLDRIKDKIIEVSN